MKQNRHFCHLLQLVAVPGPRKFRHGLGHFGGCSSILTGHLEGSFGQSFQLRSCISSYLLNIDELCVNILHGRKSFLQCPDGGSHQVAHHLPSRHFQRHVSQAVPQQRRAFAHLLCLGCCFSLCRSCLFRLSGILRLGCPGPLNLCLQPSLRLCSFLRLRGRLGLCCFRLFNLSCKPVLRSNPSLGRLGSLLPGKRQFILLRLCP